MELSGWLYLCLNRIRTSKNLTEILRNNPDGPLNIGWSVFVGLMFPWADFYKEAVCSSCPCCRRCGRWWLPRIRKSTMGMCCAANVRLTGPGMEALGLTIHRPTMALRPTTDMSTSPRFGPYSLIPLRSIPVRPDLRDTNLTSCEIVFQWGDTGR